VDVDSYLRSSERWPDEMRAMRPVLVEAGLDEAIKWKKPCYSFDGANIAIMQEMKEFLALMFFKGALLDDPAGVLEAQGPNSRAAMRMTFRSVDDVVSRADVIAAYVTRAIEVEQAALEVPTAAEPRWCEELQARLDGDPAFKAAFDGLTPGRRREYHLHISEAKQSSTRERRIDKYTDRILAGKGMRDR
jgi:uncharacterized protein YdeI (YjbR/CyaY-like superfamily)